ncbi:hypothetical protein FXO38_19158 [Capsicum annuum]|nr:hypothetical protein FXO38_19158 [Capsicum annuum]
MYEKIKFDSTLSRKSPGIIQEHSPINFSRPSFDLGCFTPSPKSKSKKKVVEVDSIPHNKIKISPEKSDCSKISPSLKQQQLNMQNNRVSKEVVVPDFEKVDKRKKNVGQHDSDSDFEDEIFLPKMKKSKKNLVKMLELQGLRYYPSMDKVMRSVFYDDFVNKKISYRVEDLYEIGLVYFLSRFLQSELPRTFIKKANFDLVESGQYLKYDWGGECFQYVFRDIAFTNEEEVEFNLGVIHQDSLGHEHRNDSDHSVPSISEDTFIVLKNEIVNVESEFNGMREFVQESVKLILNELRLHVDVIMYYLRKKSKYSVIKPITYITIDVFFVKWIRSIHQQWLSLNEEMSCITPEHRVSQYIRGYKLLANVPWDFVDNIIISVNVSESFHWILVVFRIRHRCLYVYDSMMGGVIHSKNFLDYVRSLLTMMPMFLVATNFYGKRSDIDWHREAVYIDKSLSEPLDDCGMFVCDFAEYVSHDIFDISSRLFDAVNHRIRYGALLWDYARRKQNDGAISENEATGNVTSKHGGFKRSREQFGSTRTQ